MILKRKEIMVFLLLLTPYKVYNKMKILFLHPEIVWYRVPLFVELSKIADVQFVFTKVDFSKGDYSGLYMDADMSGLNKIDYIIYNDRNKISYKCLKKAITEKYDYIVVPYLDSKDLKIESIICAVIAKLKGKKVAYYWEKWVDLRQLLTRKQRVKQKLQDRFVRLHSLFVDCYLVPGKKTYEYYEKIGINLKKCYIVRNASEIVNNDFKYDIRLKYGIPTNAKIILYFGRVIKLKGLDLLIKAFRRIKSNNAILLICGDGDYLIECKEYAEDCSIKNIVFAGNIQPNYRQYYFEQSNIFVLPNRFYKGNDAWGLSLNEAMQYGKPVIASEATGAAYDLIVNGENGFIIKNEDVDELAKALKLILEDEDLEKRMGNRSLEIIKNYSYKIQAELMVDAMKKTM